MGFDHAVTKERVVCLGPSVEHFAGVIEQSKRVLEGRKGKRSAGGDELGEKIDIGFEGVSENESVDLEERGSCVCLLEKVQAFSLNGAPKLLCH